MKYLAILLALALTGCASGDYAEYAKAQGEIARAKSDSDAARYAALSKIAETGTESSRIAAVMALAFGSGTSSQALQQVQAPAPSQALQWASIIVPSLTNIAGMHYASRTAITSAESAATVAKSTNEAFVGIAAKIQAPVVAAAVLPQANVTTTNTTTTTTSTDNHAVSTTTSTANPTTTTNTLSGTGTLGSGAFSTAANPVTTTTTTTNPATTGVMCGVSVAGTVNCIP